MKVSGSWVFKYAMVISALILRWSFDVAPSTPTTSEIGRIGYQAFHCIYCNPGYYPHGWLWYAIMLPMFYFFNASIGLGIMAAIDATIMIYMIPRNWLFYPYYLLSFITYFAVVQNMPIIWITLLGSIEPWFLALAIVTKLPFGAPWADWYFVLHSSINISSNYEKDYGYLVAWWLYILGYHYRVRVKKGFFKLMIMMMERKKRW